VIRQRGILRLCQTNFFNLHRGFLKKFKMAQVRLLTSIRRKFTLKLAFVQFTLFSSLVMAFMKFMKFMEFIWFI